MLGNGHHGVRNLFALMAFKFALLFICYVILVLHSPKQNRGHCMNFYFVGEKKKAKLLLRGIHDEEYL